MMADKRLSVSGVTCFSTGALEHARFLGIQNGKAKI